MAKLIENSTRQHAQWAMQEFDYTNVAAAQYPIVALPAGATVISGGVQVLTAFNYGTSAVIDVGTAGSATLFANDLDLATTGFKPFTGTYKYLPAGDTVVTAPAVAGTAATAGKAILMVQYLVDGRQDTIQYKSGV